MRLQVTGLSKSFAGVHALQDVSFTLESGELLGLIGPNGSGKTTALDCISGFQRLDSGQIVLDGRACARKAPHTLARRGMLRTFQSVRLFASLSTKKNVMTSAFTLAGGRIFRQPEAARRDLQAEATELISSYDLDHLADAPASALSYGQRKIVEFIALLLCRPRLVLLDEPIAAINPTLAQRIRGDIVELHRRGVTILLVEHNLELVTGICDRVVVLDHGTKIAEGDPDQVLARREVQEAYFGR
jgi:branched-chain amino acid transport system ATP-binding protein